MGIAGSANCTGTIDITPAAADAVVKIVSFADMICRFPGIAVTAIGAVHVSGVTFLAGSAVHIVLIFGIFVAIGSGISLDIGAQIHITHGEGKGYHFIAVATSIFVCHVVSEDQTAIGALYLITEHPLIGTFGCFNGFPVADGGHFNIT